MDLISSQHCACNIVILTNSRSLNMAHVHKDDMMVIRMAGFVIIMMYFGTNAHIHAQVHHPHAKVLKFNLVYILSDVQVICEVRTS